MTDQTPILRNGTGIQWTTDMKLRLSELWHAEPVVSVTQISLIMTGEFGTTISRNAVVGKANRLGFPPRGEPKSIADARQNKTKAAKRERIFKPKRQYIRAVDTPLPPDAILAPGQNEAWYRADQLCQWPQVDKTRDATKCENPRVEGRPYCECHARRAIAAFGVHYNNSTIKFLSSAGSIRRGQ